MKYVLMVLLLVVTAEEVEARNRLFGRRANTRVNASGGKETFPSGTPYATGNPVCVNGVCTIPTIPVQQQQAVPTPIIKTLASAEDKLVLLEQQFGAAIASARAEVALARVAQQREASHAAIDLKYQIEDMNRKLEGLLTLVPQNKPVE